MYGCMLLLLLLLLFHACICVYAGCGEEAAHALHGSWGCYFRVFSALLLEQRLESRTGCLYTSAPQLQKLNMKHLEVPG